MSVKRYWSYAGGDSSMQETETGSYVKYEDYASLERKNIELAVQLANAESKCRELAEEISRRDEIFVPVYPDENTMNRMTDVFHDTAKIHCDEDSIFVDNAELVITAIINHYIKSDDAFLAEVRAQGVEMLIDSLAEVGGSIEDTIDLHHYCSDFSAQLRKGASL